MIASQAGGASFGHSFHHSRLISAPSSEVGSCWYCADHFEMGSSAFSASNCSKGQNSGHRGAPDGIIAGNSMTSHSSAPSLWVADLIIWPVRSLTLQRVITIMMAPPGWSLWRGPDVYHS